MATKRYVKYFFKVIDRLIIYLMLIQPKLEKGFVDGGEF